MDKKIDENTQSPFDSEPEDETIALSKDELDNILSEAEIVQEVSEEANEDQSQNLPEDENFSDIDIDLSEESEKPDENEKEEKDFDISQDIEELSHEDLEGIEIEEEKQEEYSQDLEKELTNEMELPEGDQLGSGDLIEEEISDEELEKELENFDTEGLQLEANLDEEEMDLDSYIKSVEENVGEEITFEESSEQEPETSVPTAEESEQEAAEETGEESEEGIEAGLLESPILGEIEDIEIDAEDAFREAGIEDIELSEEEGGEEAVQEQPEETMDISDLNLDELSKEIPEEGKTEEETAEQIEAGTKPAESASLEDELAQEEFEGEIQLTEEEEKILKEDIDLTSEIPEEPSGEISEIGIEEKETGEEEEEEEIVSLSGEELDRIVEEEQITEEEPETATIDKTLLNDITVILKYLDDLLGNLPEEKIKEFANSKYFALYKEVFNKLGIS